MSKLPFVEVKDGKLSVELKEVPIYHCADILADIMKMKGYRLGKANFLARGVEGEYGVPYDDHTYKITIEPIKQEEKGS